MMLRYLFLALTLGLPAATSAQTVWINEFHYDNAGADADEFIEIAGPAGTDLFGFIIMLYNGSNGQLYTPAPTLSGTIPDLQDGYGVLSFPAPGLQNGNPDGIALCHSGGDLVQFLSYEGTFIAKGGCADGVESVDVGVSESETTPKGHSLQLRGSGSQYGDFVWTGPEEGSPGGVNSGQTFLGVTVVRFTAVSGEAAEGDGTFGLAVSILNPSETEGTTVGVALRTDLSSGTSDDIGGFTSETLTFPAGSGADQILTLTLTDDDLIEEDETFVFELQDVSGGDAIIGEPSRFTLALVDDDVADFVFINEIDSDTPGADTAEFIELYDGGVGGTPLDGLVLVFFNGSNLQSYRAFSLDGDATGPGGFFVLCGSAENVAGCDREVTPATNLIQNGGSVGGSAEGDAIALYVGDASAFPSGTAPTAAGLLDVVVYGINNSRDGQLLAAFGTNKTGVPNVVTAQFDEAYNRAHETESLQRMNAVLGGEVLASELFYALPPTPGVMNPSQITVDATGEVAPVAGWRMLSSPVAELTGASTYDGPVVGSEAGEALAKGYADINLVQGVPASGGYPQEYPAEADNLFHDYLGGGVYAEASGTGMQLPPGEGFYWYWYHDDFGPFAGGTSQSYALDAPDFSLSLTGNPLDDQYGGPVTNTEPYNADGVYLIGNPFAYPLLAGAIGVANPTLQLQSSFGVWDATASPPTYQILTADFDDPYAEDAVPVWNGLFAQVTPAGEGGEDPTFTFSSDYVDPTASASFIGRLPVPEAVDRRRAATAREARVSFRLDGITGDGTAVADNAALFRFRDDATPGWDVHDFSKLYPLGATVALIAPIGARDGVPHLQAVRSLPQQFTRRSDTQAPMAFFTNSGGTFTLSWTLRDVPEQWQLHLRDSVAGAVVDLRRVTSHTFAASGTGWAERFTLSVTPASPFVAAHLGLPDGYALGPVYPNPARSSARFALEVAEAQDVTVAVYDVLGRRVALLHDGLLADGTEHVFTVDGRALASGLYVVRAEGATFVETRRLTIMR